MAKDLGQGIFFSHPIAGIGLDAHELGEMSLECALYLDMLYTKQFLTEDDETSANPQRTLAFFDQPILRSALTRSYVAATRGYRPALILDSGTLSPVGFRKAEVASRIVHHLASEGVDLNPDTFVDGDHSMITASIPRRALSLLSVVNQAIMATEQLYRQNRADIHKGYESYQFGPETTPQQIREFLAMKDHMNKLHKSPQKKQEPTEGQEQPKDTYTVNPHQPMPKPLYTNKLLDLTDVRQFADTVQEVSASLYEVASGNFEAWVPTATFAQKARTDLKYLIKFGLVDMKAYVTSGRGRPKHVLRVSTPGVRLLAGLLRDNIMV